MNKPYNLISKKIRSLSITVYGCGIPEVKPGISLSINGDSAKATCNVTNHITHLTCNGREWVGDVADCLTGTNKLSLNEDYSDYDGVPFLGGMWNSTVGIILVVGLGVIIGATIGVAALFLFALCYRRMGRNGHYYGSSAPSRYYTHCGRDSKMYLHLSTMDSNSSPHQTALTPEQMSMKSTKSLKISGSCTGSPCANSAPHVQFTTVNKEPLLSPTLSASGDNQLHLNHHHQSNQPHHHHNNQQRPTGVATSNTNVNSPDLLNSNTTIANDYRANNKQKQNQLQKVDDGFKNLSSFNKDPSLLMVPNKPQVQDASNMTRGSVMVKPPQIPPSSQQHVNNVKAKNNINSVLNSSKNTFAQKCILPGASGERILHDNNQMLLSSAAATNKDGLCKTTVKTSIVEELTKYEAPFAV